MPFAERSIMIEKLERIRGSKIICYVTSLRENVNALISDDAVREFVDHLRTFGEKPKKLDVFIVSNGGGTVLSHGD